MSTASDTRLAIGTDTAEAAALDAVREWIERHVPRVWIDAGRSGGATAVRRVRSRAEYEAWYPVFASSGLVAPTWPVNFPAALRSPSASCTSSL